MTPPVAFTIGRDTTPFGRWIRVILGLLFIVAAGLSTISLTDRADVLPLLVSFVSILIVYYIAYLALEKPLLAHSNPWLNALVFVVPALGIAFVPVFPSALRAGMFLYLGVTQVLNGLMRYGGCEVLAVPTLIYRRRYDVYCPTNVLDAAEQAIVGSRGKPTQQNDK